MSSEKPKRGLGRKLLIGVLVLFGACAVMTFAAFLISDPEPTAETAERSAATIDIAGQTEEPAAVVEPTNVPPTDTAIPPIATIVPPTETPVPPTEIPVPTATIPLTADNLEIIRVNKGEEYVDILNGTAEDVMLTGWVLESENGSQTCPLDGVGLFPAGYTLRVWAEARPPADAEFSCGFENEIWNNSEPDAAVLIDPSGAEVSRR